MLSRSRSGPMSEFLDKLKQTELDRVALAEAESRIASEARALEAAQSRLAVENEARRAAQARLDAAAEAGRIARERLVTELELKRAARARAEREADAALASLESESPAGDAPRPRRTEPRGGWLVLLTALRAALAAAVAAGISIGRFGADKAPKPAMQAATRPLPPPGLKLDRDLKAFAKRASELKEKQ